MKIKMLLFAILLMNFSSNIRVSPYENKNELERNIIICCFDKDMKPIGRTEMKILHFETTIRFIKCVISLDQKCSPKDITMFTASNYINSLPIVGLGHKLINLSDELTLKKIWDKDGQHYTGGSDLFWAKIEPKKK